MPAQNQKAEMMARFACSPNNQTIPLGAVSDQSVLSGGANEAAHVALFTKTTQPARPSFFK